MAKHKPKTEISPRRRWITIGPGILIALILALQVAIRNHTAPSGPPIIERQVVGGEIARPSSPALQVDYILARAKHLKLSEGQQSSLRNLQDEWAAKSKPLTDAINQAAGDFERFMKSAGGKATMKEIQAHAAPVSELSTQVSSLRRVYWEKALQVLDKQQRKILQERLIRGTIYPNGTFESRKARRDAGVAKSFGE